jgi:Flavodoxin-like fold
VNVLVVYAHPISDCFTHAVLAQVTRGLDESPHRYEVSDLSASGFDPVFTDRDTLQFLHESLPAEVLDVADPREAVLRAARGPVRRYLARRFLAREEQSERSPRRSGSAVPGTCESSRPWPPGPTR